MAIDIAPLWRGAGVLLPVLSGKGKRIQHQLLKFRPLDQKARGELVRSEQGKCCVGFWGAAEAILKAQGEPQHWPRGVCWALVGELGLLLALASRYPVVHWHWKIDCVI